MEQHTDSSILGHVLPAGGQSEGCKGSRFASSALPGTPERNHEGGEEDRMPKRRRGLIPLDNVDAVVAGELEVLVGVLGVTTERLREVIPLTHHRFGAVAAFLRVFA